jgi:hypothetical protein
MTLVLITLTTALVLNLAVLGLLKMGLRDSVRGCKAAGEWSGRQPC